MKRVTKSRYRFGSFFLLLMLVVQTFLSAGCSEIAKELITGSNQTPLQKFNQQHGWGWDVRWTPGRKRVTNLVGQGTRPYAGDPRENATNFLRENSALFGLQ